EALYRTLAVPVLCDVDQPPFDRSVMDGFALRVADIADAPARLRIVGRLGAGATPHGCVNSGEAIQINTGAVIPRGADAVVRIEDTDLTESGDEVLIRKCVERGNFITRRAEYVSAGEEVLPAGTVMTPIEVGIAATVGCTAVRVYRRPTVGILATGDELIDIDRRPAGAQIRDSNRHLLEMLVLDAHAEPVALGVVPDDPAAIRAKILQGCRCDALCITGGVSMGTSDYVPEVIESLGATIRIRKMAIKPGRPVHFATARDGVPIFALPGNPIGTFVGFELLVRPALAALEGRSGVVPRPMRATLRGKLSATSDRRTFRPARARVAEDGEWEVEPLSWRGSGDLVGAGGANALIVRPPLAPGVGAGESVFALFVNPV
ncbi:MAG: gephyrin-like molybdotransferase Glp, partial [Phycisphaerae bacterium]